MDSLSQLYDSHYRELIRLAALLTGDTAVAEPIVQSAFADTHRVYGRHGPDRQLPYLRRRVVIRARSVRAASAGTRSQSTAASSNGEARAHAMPAAIAALASVPSRCRETIVLRYFADMTEAEIAASVGISVRSVRHQLDEGLAAFETALSERGSDFSH